MDTAEAMSRSERDKGRKGEAEVAELYRSRGLEVRGLEATGDHLVICGELAGYVLHSEVKRQETARPWAWWEQASREAPANAVPVVNFRRNRSPWLAIVPAAFVAQVIAELEEARRRIVELELATPGKGW